MVAGFAFRVMMTMVMIVGVIVVVVMVVEMVAMRRHYARRQCRSPALRANAGRDGSTASSTATGRPSRSARS
jgi:uncharacterized membrane protein